MTRKDYIKIAAILKDVRPSTSSGPITYAKGSLIDILALKFANMLQADNPHFDRERFLEAAGFKR